jgi:hypothetical protein
MMTTELDANRVDALREKLNEAVSDAKQWMTRYHIEKDLHAEREIYVKGLEKDLAARDRELVLVNNRLNTLFKVLYKMADDGY